MADTRTMEQVIYHFLVEVAQKEETTNYLEIAERFGLPTQGNQLSAVLSPILGRIANKCIRQGRAPITVLVVRKSGADANIPGKGFWELHGIETEHFKKPREVKMAMTEMLSCMVFDDFRI